MRLRQPKLLTTLQDALLSCERKVALLDRLFPLNFADEVESLEAGLVRGRIVLPRFIYRPLPADFSRTIDELSAIRVALGTGTADRAFQSVVELMYERACELELEARMVVEVGRPGFLPLLRSRFGSSSSVRQRSQRLARAWLAESAEDDPPSESVGLASYLSRRAISEGYSFPIIERKLATVAAASSEALFVEEGATVTVKEADRIWYHEVHAHLLPRLVGTHSCAPLCCGTSGAGDDEEGRALLLEERHALLGPVRKKQLAVRHLLADAQLYEPERIEEEALNLFSSGVPAPQLAHALSRVLRGGGLSREIVYLPRMIELKRHFSVYPHHERWLKWGRVSIEAVPALERFLQGNSMTQGA